MAQRTRSQSVPLALDDVNQLIRQVEEKIISRLDVVLDRFSALEKRQDAVQIAFALETKLKS